MAKTRRDANHNGKKTISTNAIFKKAAKKSDNKAIRAEEVAQRSFKIEKASKAMKSHHQRKVKKQAERPLAAAFSDTIEASRESIQDSANADLDLALLELETRLSRSDEYYRQLHQDAVLFNETLALPFQNQELEWTSHDGKQSGTTVLGARMKKLEKTVEAEEKELNLQHADLLVIQQELFNLVGDVMGPAGIDQWIAGNLNSTTLMGGFNEKVELEIAAEKKKIVTEIEKLEKDSMKKMKESDKKLQLQQRDMEQSLIAILADEDY